MSGMSIGSNAGVYNYVQPPKVQGEQQNTEMPPSNKTYRKNGKKVRANLGWGWGSVITGGVTAQLLAIPISNVFTAKQDLIENGFKLEERIAAVADAEKKLKAGGVDETTKYFMENRLKTDKKMVKFFEGEKLKSAKAVKAAYKAIPKWAAIGIALGVGAVLFTNHLRNNKRAKLAAEPDNGKQALNKTV